MKPDMDSGSSMNTTSTRYMGSSNTSIPSEAQDQPAYKNREWKDIFPELIGLDLDHDENQVELEISRPLRIDDTFWPADIGGASIESWMTQELNQSTQNVDSAHINALHNDLSDRDVICYGMIYRAAAKLTGNMSEISRALGDPETRTSVSGTHFILKVVPEGGHLYVMVSPEVRLAVLNDHLDESMRKLVESRAIYLEAVIKKRILFDEIGSATRANLAITQVNINVYGPSSSSFSTGRHLSKHKIWLQRPDWLNPLCIYNNPHVIKFDGLADGVQNSSIEDDEVKQSEEETLQDSVQGVYSMLTREAYLDNNMAEDLRLGTPLMPHQIKAQEFMIQRETGPIPEQFELWETIYKDNQTWYKHKVAGIKSRSRPAETGGGILADEMGMGKTLSMLSLIVSSLDGARKWAADSETKLADGILPSKQLSRATLVVVPSPLLLATWIDEITSRLKVKLQVFIHHGRDRPVDPKDVYDNDIVLTTYYTLHADHSKKQSPISDTAWYRIVLDEAHFIRSTTTHLHKRVTELDAKYRWCLTGTPIQNHLDDVGALFAFLKIFPFDRISIFRRCITVPFKEGGISKVAAQENLAKLLDAMCIRRTKILLKLKPFKERIRHVNLSPEERNQYNKTKEDMRRTMRNVIVEKAGHNRFGMFQAQLQLRLLCNHGTHQYQFHWARARNVVDEQEDAVVSLASGNSEGTCSSCHQLIPITDLVAACRLQVSCIHMLCQECRQDIGENCPLCEATKFRLGSSQSGGSNRAPQARETYFQSSGYSSKMAALVQELQSTDPDDKSIVFSHWTKTLDLVGQYLEKHKIHFERIDGNDNLLQRRKTLDKFRNDSSLRILVMTTGIGALGLDLITANHVHLIEPQWNPSVELQAIGRTLRIGQRRTVTIIRYIVQDAIEQYMGQLQQRKLRLAGIAQAKDRMPLVDDRKVKDEILNGVEGIIPEKGSGKSLQKDVFVQRFTEILYNGLFGLKISETDAVVLCAGMGDLLAEFTFKLRQENPGAHFREAAVLFQQNCGHITGSLLRLFNVGTISMSEEGKASLATIPRDELISRWVNHEIPDTGTIQKNFDPEHKNDMYPEDLTAQVFEELISNSRSYQWLLSRLRNRLLLNWEDSDVCNGIALSILSELQLPDPVGEYVSVPVFQVEIKSQWPVRKLLQEQLSPMSICDEFGKIVTLTGSFTNAQASTCSAYLCQTWPQTGMFFVRVLKDALRQETSPANVFCPDGTLLVAQFNDAVCTVLIKGSRDVVVEIAQQFAWVSATLRAPPPGHGIVSCTPRITYEGPDAGTKSSEGVSAARELTEAYTKTASNSSSSQARLENKQRSPVRTKDGRILHKFHIDFDFSKRINDTDHGHCWRHMFGTCTLVKGFPITRRPETGLGLEISLNMMAGLIGSRHVNEYCGNLFMKGYSAMLVPVRKLPEIIVWHLLYSETEDHISYREFTGDGPRLEFQDLEESRHIVGWCANITNHSGSAVAVSLIQKSDLTRTRPGCVLDSFRLTFGTSLVRKPEFVLLKFHESGHAASGIFHQKFEYLARHFSLLWDTDADRGWLLTCLDTFFHLMHSFVIAYPEPLASLLLRRCGQLQNIAKCAMLGKPSAFSGSTAASAGRQGSTMQGDIHDRDEAEEAAEQMISEFADQLYDAMEKLITRQEEAEWEDARRSRRSLRYLEGWEYHDLTNHHGLKWPRVTMLPSVAFTWARLLRTLDTITIFGQGFGSLLSPSQFQPVPQHLQPRSVAAVQIACCPDIETGKFHVGAAIRDLKRMICSSAKHSSGHLVLGKTAILPRHTSLFINCCQRIDTLTLTGSVDDSIQMPWPFKHRNLLLIDDQPEGEDWKQHFEKFPNGGVIFGHDEKVGWHIDENGSPIKGQPPQPSSEPTGSFEDDRPDSNFNSGSSSEKNLNPIHSKSDIAMSSQTSLLLSGRGHNFGNSKVSRSNAIFGNIYKVVHNNNNIVSASQTTCVGTLPEERNLQEAPVLAALPGWPAPVTCHGSKRSFLDLESESLAETASPRSPENPRRHSSSKRQRLSTDDEEVSGDDETAPICRDNTPKPNLRLLPSPGTLIEDRTFIQICCICQFATSDPGHVPEKCGQCMHGFCDKCGAKPRLGCGAHRTYS